MVTALVKIWDKLVGAVLWDENTQLATFEFDPSFAQNNWDLSPILMPLNEIKRGNRLFSFPRLNPETFYGMSGLLSDALPDKFGTTLINAWLATQGRTPNSINPVERLCYMGKRGMGALEFEPAFHPKQNMASHIEIDALVEIARTVLNQREGFTTILNEGNSKGLEDIIKVGTSAGGARAKAIIAYNPSTNEVRSGQVAAPKGFSHWLIKFDGISDAQLSTPLGFGRIEFAYYKMAIDCGIEMSECSIFEENGRAHFMTKRFDRAKGKEKLHFQSLCGIAHFDFSQTNAYSYEQAFQVMRTLSLPYQAAEQLYRRMVFNVVARNLDDHTKNIAFLMNKAGEWRLAPAYDLTWSYDPNSIWVSKHNLSINGKRDNITKDDLLKVGKEMSIKQPINIINQVIETIKNWNNYAEKAGVKPNQIKQIGETLLVGL